MPAGPPLVLVHGIGASKEDWEAQIPFFSKTRRVIAADLRGFGVSPKGSVYSVPAFAADIWALLDQCRIDTFDLVGHSMGGAVVLQMAVDQPDRVRRLVLADTLASFEANSPGKLALYWYRLLMMMLVGPARLSAVVAERLLPRPEHAALRERMTQRSAQNDRHVYLQTIRAIKGWTVMDRLDRLRMPTLVLVAEEDYFPVADAERLVEALPNAQLVVFEHAHHHLPLECSGRFNTVLSAFLEDRPAASGGAMKPCSEKAI